MTIKRVLLPFCDIGGVQHLTEAASVVGRLFSAHVRGLFAWAPHFSLPISDDNVNPELLTRAIENATRERVEKLQQAQRVFKSCAEQFPHVQSEFAASEGKIGDLVAHAARLADLSILGSGSSYALNVGGTFVTARFSAAAGRSWWFPPQASTNGASTGSLSLEGKRRGRAGLCCGSAFPPACQGSPPHRDWRGPPIYRLAAGRRAISAALLCGGAQRDHSILGGRYGRNSAQQVRRLWWSIVGHGRLQPLALAGANVRRCYRECTAERPDAGSYDALKPDLPRCSASKEN